MPPSQFGRHPDGVLRGIEDFEDAQRRITAWTIREVVFREHSHGDDLRGNLEIPSTKRGGKLERLRRDTSRPQNRLAQDVTRRALVNLQPFHPDSLDSKVVVGTHLECQYLGVE